MKRIHNNRNVNFVGKLSSIALLIMMVFSAHGEEILTSSTANISSNVTEFESDLLRVEGSSKVDVRRFSYGTSASPGKYRVNVFINDIQASYEDVEFKETANKQVKPCLTPRLIELINFKQDRLSAEALQALTTSEDCIDLEKIIPDARVEFNSSDQQLNIEVPQIYVNRAARGSVSPDLWDSGIPALILGYYTNSYDSSYSGGNSNRSVYASFNSGLNIGAWYLRHNGAYNWQKDQGGKYQTTNTYLQRDVAVLRGRFVVGESNTSGQLFNSVPFTGFQLASDDRMLPDSQRGYAPEIRGIAKTNAKVTVRQLGNIIYETTVTPGAFLINDLYPTGYGGDLDVTILEADGSVQQYSIPYASVAQLLRPGVHQYSITVGKLRDSGVSDEPILYEATYQRGLNNTFTGYAGAQSSENYQALQLGTAVGTSYGAVGVDATQAFSRLGYTAGNIAGQSYRISYSKLINETNSNVTLAAYRFSSSGYMDFLTAMQTREAAKQDVEQAEIWRSKNRVQLSVNQGLLEGWGSLYASFSMENYWDSQQGYNKYYQLGYSNSYQRVNYSVNVNRNKSGYGVDQTTWYLNFSMPLWEGRETRAPYLSLRYNQDNGGGKGEQAMLSGSLGENNKYGYNLSAGYDNKAGSSGNIGGSWQSSVAQLNGSYSTGQGYHSTSLGVSGAMVVHSGGITLTPYNSDNYALIEAKGAEGAKVAGYAGATVDMFGYALYPSLVPYQMNQVSIDPDGSALDIEFENTSLKVAPRAGAVVKVKFKTHRGTPVLITSTFAGEQIPFGADVFDENNIYVGSVTQGGVIYARVSETRGTLLVKWGEDMHSRCQVGYILAPESADKNRQSVPQQFNTHCQERPIQDQRHNRVTSLAENN